MSKQKDVQKYLQQVCHLFIESGIMHLPIWTTRLCMDLFRGINLLLDWLRYISLSFYFRVSIACGIL